jgi:hypothetical protein
MRNFLSYVLMALLPACSLAAAPSTQPLTDEQKMQNWWDDLEKNDDIVATRALLNFSDKPRQAVAFFKERLKPLIITDDEVNKLIGDLGSDDEAVWKPAFEKLDYYDPRLAIDLQTLMDNTTEPVSRHRLVEILSGRPANSLEGKTLKLNKFGGPDDYNFADDRGSWWAEHRVDRLKTGNGWGNPKYKWVRACRAIILLEHIASPEAVAILRDMSTGHPDAEPTKAAQEALERIESGDKDK